MTPWFIQIRYLNDSQWSEDYRAYTKSDDVFEVEDIIVNLPEYPSIESNIIDYYSDDEDEESWVSVEVFHLDEVNLKEEDDYFKSLPILIDERNV